MATVKIQGNASGSGSVTLVAPNTNSNRTVTLPDEDLTIGPAPSTSYLGVGSYAGLYTTSGFGQLAIGSTASGSSLRHSARGAPFDANIWVAATSSVAGTTVSGTWRNMGPDVAEATVGGYYGVNLWVRIA